MQEFDSLLELLAMLVKQPRIAVLFALLLLAGVIDFYTYKIPNWLTAGGIVFGLILSMVSPFYRDYGFFWAVGGMLIGFLIMLPCYILKIMGAGDVKLMAMVGAFLGVTDTLHAVIYSFIAGGLAALMFAMYNKAFIRLLGNIKNITQMMMFAAIGGYKPEVQIQASQSVGKLPYGACIGLGTACYLVARQLGYTQ